MIRSCARAFIERPMKARRNGLSTSSASTAGAWTADQNDIVGVVDELAPVKLTHQCFIDFARRKVKAAYTNRPRR